MQYPSAKYASVSFAASMWGTPQSSRMTVTSLFIEGCKTVRSRSGTRVRARYNNPITVRTMRSVMPVAASFRILLMRPSRDISCHRVRFFFGDIRHALVPKLNLGTSRTSGCSEVRNECENVRPCPRFLCRLRGTRRQSALLPSRGFSRRPGRVAG